VRLVVTPGMGIGPEVTARALSEVSHEVAFTLMGAATELQPALDEAGVPWTTASSACGCTGVCVVDTSSSDEPAPVAAIRLGARAVMDGEADALVTGPIHKARLRQQGFPFMGHTDMLGELCAARPVMAFTGGRLRVALVTTHLPLEAVSGAITPERVAHTVRTAHDALVDDLGITAPKLMLCGLNPHAGEGGELGDTEQRVLQPVADMLRAEGLGLTGPICAETAFMSAARGEVDMVVAMYHDQGLVPLKVVDFGRSVNWTLGLPIIRTSVDHGTADSLVGTGRADSSSMTSAIQLAMDIVRRRAGL
jgi:4-hydroxythreonine-4-phosphate dehydrogenase